jgi:hypothetical protein
LCRQTDFSPELLKELNPIYSNVLQAFWATPPSARRLARARAHAENALSLALSAAAHSIDATALPALTTVMTELAILLSEEAGSATAPVVLPSHDAPSVKAPLMQGTTEGVGPVPDRRRPAEPRHVRPRGARPAVPLRSFADPSSATTNMVAILSNVARLHFRRKSLLRSPLACWQEYRSVDALISCAIQAIDWIGSDGREEARAELARAEDEDGRFAALTGLFHTGAADEALAFVAEQASEATPSRGALLSVRLSASDSALDRLEAMRPQMTADLRVTILTARAERGQLSASDLIPMLADPDEGVAIRVATLLPWFGSSADERHKVVGWIDRTISDHLRSAVLYAAASLGSNRAIQELRRALDAGGLTHRFSVDTLAVAGGPEDVVRLLDLAERSAELAPVAVLAAGHLGSPTHVGAILEAKNVEDDIKERARETVLGGEPTGRASGRLLYGAPWTTVAALDRLAASDELLQARPWYALESAVRVGATAGALVDLGADVRRQHAAVAQIRRAVKAHSTRGGIGRWLYRGGDVA